MTRRSHPDDLGHPVRLPARVERVVSLVPSLTEALAATDPALVAGCTRWCTHPPGLRAERVRGTKNPHVRRIIEMAPDLVVANQEENRERHVRELRAAGIPVWVTVVRDLAEAFASMRRLITVACARPEPAWLAEAEAAWREPAPLRGVRVAVPIWRDPWLAVGRDTFAGDLLARLGAVNVYADAADRYPAADPRDIAARAPDAVLLPDEPYAFSASDGPEAFPRTRTVLIEGRDLTWYGPSLAAARERLAAALPG
ncbi:helical backbone metal receptor [Nocardiopsis mangrovi]|uniref:Helical backbone metal receptor n=1 Tax=Nocardiopsis mangrovi TaxID=1179818 RepID=A0ABV9E132_9ACTN